jgi:hypothetical protein
LPSLPTRGAIYKINVAALNEFAASATWVLVKDYIVLATNYQLCIKKAIK